MIFDWSYQFCEYWCLFIQVYINFLHCVLEVVEVTVLQKVVVDEFGDCPHEFAYMDTFPNVDVSFGEVAPTETTSII